MKTTWKAIKSCIIDTFNDSHAKAFPVNGRLLLQRRM